MTEKCLTDQIAQIPGLSTLDEFAKLGKTLDLHSEELGLLCCHINLSDNVEKVKLKCQRGICPWPSHVDWRSTLKIVVVGIRFWPPYPYPLMW